MKSDEAVILLGHGSLLCGAERAIFSHASSLQRRLPNAGVEGAFLNYSEPRFGAVATRMIHDGACSITVVPYFLAPGKFSLVDVPSAIEETSRSFPSVAFQLAPAIGFDERIAEAIAEMANRAVGLEGLGQLRRETFTLCTSNPRCPLRKSGECPGEWETEANVWKPTQLWNPEWTRTTALCLLAHGSPMDSANEPLRAVAAQIRTVHGFAQVEIGYLECNEPSIPDALDRCANGSANHIVASPYFLLPGKHLVRDIPAEIQAAYERHESRRFWLSPAIGDWENLAEVLESRVAEAARVR